MRKKIRPPRPADEKARRKNPSPRQAGVWQGRILLFLESGDPRLLDKETYKVYCRIRESGVRFKGPVPLPVTHPAPESEQGWTELHRRLFMVSVPTEEFIPILEKLPLSHTVKASFKVEEAGSYVL